MPNYQPVKYIDFMSLDLWFHKDGNDLSEDYFNQGSFMFECEKQMRRDIVSYQPSLFGPFGLDD